MPIKAPIFWPGREHDALSRGGFLVGTFVSLFTTSFHLCLASPVGEPESSPALSKALFKEFCFDCHNSKKSKGDINLESLLSGAYQAKDFQTWELIHEMIETQEMPPEDEPQPSAPQRAQLALNISTALERMKAAAEGDPGPVVLRRLTSAEYNYAIKDLTGLDLQLNRLIASDAVGGEGFSNVGEVQFVQDATIERYLEAAKTVASHALIGAGPLQFYSNPGKTGQELAAINRIQSIYRDHGFRTGAGEGAEAFGLDQYPNGFYATWRYRYRTDLKDDTATLTTLADQEDLAPSFVNHLWTILNSPNLSFPSSEIVRLWQDLPSPQPGQSTRNHSEPVIRQLCTELYQQLATWQKGLAANTKDDEEAAVLAEDDFQPQQEHRFRVAISWPRGATQASFDLAVAPACVSEDEHPHVLWLDPQMSMRSTTPGARRRGRSQSLRDLLPEDQRNQLDFGKGFGNRQVNDESFVTRGLSQLRITIPVPENSSRGMFSVTVKLDTTHGADCLVRCSISDGLVPGETVASTGESAALLADPSSPQLAEWQSGIAAFARNLPQVSHREPAPSDRDPIPAPWDNSYNNAERNRFHYVIKYHRDDAFLTRHLIDSDTRTILDQAWIDLLTSFDYHDTYFQFVCKKFDLPTNVKKLSSLDQEWINQTSPRARPFIQGLFDHQQYASEALKEAEARHLSEVLALASRAWRRPLEHTESERLRQFYLHRRDALKQDHPTALRALIARVFVSPSFIYRSEEKVLDRRTAPVSPEELVTRLSFFLWSSLPDPPLLQASLQGQLSEANTLETQVRRMLRNEKSRRLATEFFGQWLGFYQFDQYRGVDAERFPEFSDDIKASMYEEAIRFFHHIIREDRPIRDLLFSDYTFLNASLASHYRVDKANRSSTGSSDEFTQVKHLGDQHRGGLLQLGAILTSTSAPLRTSAVKRGDWILRRILGTPVPPPPADAGSIPADDILSDGLTVRARLEAHRTDPSCANCHSRIDPLGFALEHFDPVGRWRETYRDGQAIDDSGELSDGARISGVQGLQQYLDQNADIFIKNLTTKLLGYALGRGEQVSDQAFIDETVSTLTMDHPISDLILRVVSSPQFRFKRGAQWKDNTEELETFEQRDKLNL